MNRILNVVNFLGVLALAGLCVAQWQANERATRRADDLDRARQEQASKIAEQDRTLRANADDLAQLHDRLTKSEAAATDAEKKLALARAQNQQLESERTQFGQVIEKWKGAIAQRDQRIKRDDAQIEQLAGANKAAVTRFNDLVARYNAIVKASAAAAGGSRG